MVPVICFIGRSNSGKTLIVKQLVAELKKRHYRVATLKHSQYNFDLDIPGKDTWNYAQAGSDLVGLSFPGHVSLNLKTDSDLRLEDLCKMIGPDFDIVLAEGFKLSPMPKIHVFRDGFDDELLCPEEELMAVVAEKPMPYCVPQFSSKDIAGLARFIEDQIAAARETETVTLYVNGKPVHANAFVTHMVAQTLSGMLSSLKGVPTDIKSIDLAIRLSEITADKSDINERR